MNIRRWFFGACVIVGLGCPAESNNAPGPDRTLDAGSDDTDGGPSGGSGGKSTDQCPSSQQRCGTGCIPKLAACCDPVTTSYCTNSAGGGCYRRAGCGADFCCSTNTNLGSNDCAPSQHHCGLSCRAASEGCCSRSTDFCTAPGGSGGMDAGADAGTDGSVVPDAAIPDSDAAISGFDAGPGMAPDDKCCACNFDVYCTEFGAGGCWYCNNARYDANQVCPAPMGYLTSPGACTCDPTLFQVCM